MDVKTLADKLRDDGAVAHFLRLSLRHLPNDFIEDQREGGTAAYTNADQHGDNGCMFVWADRLYSAEHPSVVLIGEIAAALNCDYVYFDRDADPSVYLEEFEDPEDEKIDTSEIPEAGEDWFKRATLKQPKPETSQ